VLGPDRQTDFLLMLGCVYAVKADAAATTTVVRRRPAQHLLRFLMRPAVMQLIGDEPLILPSTGKAASIG
jgi:hypothetical protein